MVTDFQKNGGAQPEPIKLDSDLEEGFLPSEEGLSLESRT